jgi:hypothetical protein
MTKAYGENVFKAYRPAVMKSIGSVAAKEAEIRRERLFESREVSVSIMAGTMSASTDETLKQACIKLNLNLCGQRGVSRQ